MEYNYAQHLLAIATFVMAGTALMLFAIIKSCDWLIGLKYKTIKDCSLTRHEWNCELKEDYASSESLQHVKEDLQEIKSQNSEILHIITERMK